MQQVYFVQDGVVQAPIPAKLEYMSVEVFLTNKIYRLQRIYTTFFDYLGNLGGVFEIILFVFAILMQIHSGVEMDLYLLNHIVL